MATKVRDRNPSPIQFIETMRQLIIHTDQYLAKLPKNARFTKTVPLSQMMWKAGSFVITANGIKVKNEQDYLLRREMFQKALGAVNSLDFHLSILIDTENYHSLISEFGWENWGKLISEERRLILGIIAKDEEKYSQGIPPQTSEQTV